MKTIKGLWEQIITFDNLYETYRSAAKGKRFRNEALAFSALLEDNLYSLRDDLISENYEVGNYREFYVCEPKKRLIMALPFRDRVKQWAIYRVLNPVIAKSYIEDSFACIDGRGVHTAIKRLKYFAELVTKERGGGYYLKLDISKYFYRINHDVLMGIFRRRFADKPLLKLLEKIIRSDLPFGLESGASPGDGTARINGRGMPIGNLTSQMFANLYLNELDQYVKRQLRIHCYVRYMDDMLIIAENKGLLHEYRKKIETFLNERLTLEINDKTAIRPITLGIDFCGYKIWNTHIKLRKSTAMKMRRRLKKLQKDYAAGIIDLPKVRESLASYNGLLQHCDCYRLRREIFGVYGECGGEWHDGWFYLRRENKELN